ncbi:nuclear transport factor 2 family protein [Streptoalloteichus hindustanus]|uniref:Ketosteroid isomerase-related protein n=1 Tax=Streptoalloteichus hindustanus TaxID=2017 RepID=A0A1M5CKP7_STRHI|nr:nuclear transport factor 2 family protein [Streptoalloteichus hindustanus]SHF55355.1 Ketosteroid isomerase-related protein [Streptoalloteichus hindustanus]
MTERDHGVAGPREIVERLRRGLLGEAGAVEFTEDAVYETPFALPGMARRFTGRAAIQRHLADRAAEGMRAALDIREAVATIYDTTDPEVVAFEFDLSGVRSENAAALAGTPFRFTSSIGVLRARDGQIAHWRDFPNFLGGAEAAGALPRLAALLGGQTMP